MKAHKVDRVALLAVLDGGYEVTKRIELTKESTIIQTVCPDRLGYIFKAKVIFSDSKRSEERSYVSKDFDQIIPLMNSVVNLAGILDFFTK